MPNKWQSIVIEAGRGGRVHLDDSRQSLNINILALIM